MNETSETVNNGTKWKTGSTNRNKNEMKPIGIIFQCHFDPVCI